ncbi:unnamed protein product [Mytilus edulis]|uniref:Uncharacterized protein n=1 Tax=Mytilus edulis TaxID=6550 RepID=A0A8S3RAW4_MYTED|nr:unnamed protein product [Mytilus edulis]
MNGQQRLDFQLTSIQGGRVTESLPDSYAVVKPAVLKTNVPVIPVTDSTCKGCTGDLHEAVQNEYRWLETVSNSKEYDIEERTLVSWGAYHAEHEPIKDFEPCVSALLPLFEEEAKSVAMIKHSFDVIKTSVEALNPEEDEHHHENKTSVQKSFLKDIWSMVEVMNELGNPFMEDSQVAYSKQDNVHRFIRQLMALPYLPKEHIPAAFQKLKSRIQPNNRMYRLLTYIQRRWIDSTIFPISAWTVFGQPIRTNNDVEGWHNRLNRKAKGASLHLYVMLKVLSDEARYLPMQIQLVSEHKLTRYQRAATKRSQSKLMELWDSYRSQQLTDIAPTSVVDTIRKIEKIGKTQYEKYIEDRLIKRTVPIFEPIKKNALALFRTPHGKTVSAMKDKISILKSDVSLFSRLYISCQTRGGDLEDFFAHENNINPPALSQHGKMRLGTKSDLLSKCLEPLTTTTCDAPEVDALVIDGAAIVNMLKPSTSRMRQYCEVMIFINLEAALADGFKFFWSENTVILCAGNDDGVIPLNTL